MERKEIATLSVVAVVAALFSLIVAGALFNSPSKHTATALTVQPISSTFPDVKNDPNYNFYLNSNALDPTQPIEIGNSQNSTPFNGTQQ
jgi:hypothetical protein